MICRLSEISAKGGAPVFGGQLLQLSFLGGGAKYGVCNKITDTHLTLDIGKAVTTEIKLTTAEAKNTRVSTVSERIAKRHLNLSLQCLGAISADVTD